MFSLPNLYFSDFQNMHEKSLASTRTKEMKDATDEMKKVTDVVNKTASQAKKKLEKLGIANVHAAQVPGNEVTDGAP